ncbi:hypothetical protein V1478_017426 [Vespula squamosa]|uniref:Uncharacterized protein n=1 Tax=Vespula squamosa TaxID=30214 RepID=A0ABD1ZZD8_VESSQ
MTFVKVSRTKDTISAVGRKKLISKYRDRYSRHSQHRYVTVNSFHIFIYFIRYCLSQLFPTSPLFSRSPPRPSVPGPLVPRPPVPR